MEIDTPVHLRCDESVRRHGRLAPNVDSKKAPKGDSRSRCAWHRLFAFFVLQCDSRNPPFGDRKKPSTSHRRFRPRASVRVWAPTTREAPAQIGLLCPRFLTRNAICRSMGDMKETIVFIDIETGGLSKCKHPITELAAIAVHAGTFDELDSIEIRIRFDVRTADPRSLGLNKYNPSDWDRWAIPERDAAEKLATFLRKHGSIVQESKKRSRRYRVARIAGHNAESFDGPFLRQWYRRQKCFFPASPRVLCTKQLAMWFFELNAGVDRPEDYKLETLCRYFRLPSPDRTALQDVRSTVALARSISSALLDSALARVA